MTRHEQLTELAGRLAQSHFAGCLANDDVRQAAHELRHLAEVKAQSEARRQEAHKWRQLANLHESERDDLKRHLAEVERDSQLERKVLCSVVDRICAATGDNLHTNENVCIGVERIVKERDEARGQHRDLEAKLEAWTLAFGANDPKVSTAEFDEQHRIMLMEKNKMQAELETANLWLKGLGGDLAALEKENAELEAKCATLEKERDEWKQITSNVEASNKLYCDDYVEAKTQLDLLEDKYNSLVEGLTKIANWPEGGRLMSELPLDARQILKSSVP